MKYYLDTCIWIDLLEDRKGFNGEPLGKLAWKLLSNISSKGESIAISEEVIKELNTYLSKDEIIGIVNTFKPILIKSNENQRIEAENIGRTLCLPTSDVLHTIIARDNNLILVTRDNHFKKLENISKSYKPEELI